VGLQTACKVLQQLLLFLQERFLQALAAATLCS
jgi:hypothetical protein